MQQCWLLEPDSRPTFADVVDSLSDTLEGMADYIHISAFGMETSNITLDSQEVDTLSNDLIYPRETKASSLSLTDTSESMLWLFVYNTLYVQFLFWHTLIFICQTTYHTFTNRTDAIFKKISNRTSVRLEYIGSISFGKAYEWSMQWWNVR